MLMVIFIISIAVLLFCIMKLKLNAFVALLAVAVGTGIACGMPLMTTTVDGTTVEGIGTIIQNNFGSTLGSIGMVTGLGVILGMFMYESGGINNICNAILKTLGTDRSHFAAAFAGFITGIPVFGDVVYIMFAPMLRAMSKKSGYSMAAYGGILAVATTCTFALVLPTAPPLAVAANMGINVGLFFPYALIAAFVGMFFGGIVYGNFVNKLDQKAGKKWDFSDLAEEEAVEDSSNSMSGLKTLSILLVPIVLILLGSFSSFFLKEGTVLTFLNFIGDKNIAMLIGVLYGAFISRKYLKRSITEIMSSGADSVGQILLITGAGGAYGGILKACGIATYITDTLTGFHMPVLLMCFVIAQVLRCATGSTTTALTTTSAIVSGIAVTGGVSPVLCAIAVCAGGIGLSLPNDSGFWAITKFFHIDLNDTIRGWTLGGFVAGISILIFVSILSLFQGVLPGLM